MDRRVADDAVALADGVVEAGQLFAARGGLDPEAELADLDGLGVEVHAVEVVPYVLQLNLTSQSVPPCLQPTAGRQVRAKHETRPRQYQA